MCTATASSWSWAARPTPWPRPSACWSAFGDGPVVVGPAVPSLDEATESARAALAGFRAAPAWPAAPRPVAADDLLPERALAGDSEARRILRQEVYGALTRAGGELLETLDAFFACGGRPGERRSRRCSCTRTRFVTGCAGSAK